MYAQYRDLGESKSDYIMYGVSIMAEKSAPSTRPLLTETARAAAADWGDRHAAAARALAQRRDADGPALDRALEIVRKFVTERRLVIFGGLAIDYALRLRGGAIYPDDERPDYDMWSARSVDDAYDLADILHRAGFENVGAIRATHAQTMKVRVDFRPVADIGFVPAAALAIVPTLDYRGLLAVHPDFQRLDIHLAFCFPYMGPPQEAVYHRWRKDLKRFNLLDAAYPITDEVSVALVRRRARFDVPVTRPTGPAAELTCALTGFAGYAAICAALAETAAALGPAAARRLAEVRAPMHKLVIDPDRPNEVEVDAPEWASVVILSAEPAFEEGGEAFEPFMDTYPGGARRGDAVALTVRGRPLAVARMSVGGVDALVATQHVCLHFLFESHRAEGAARSAYRAYYRHTLELMRAAEDMFAAAAPGAADPEVAKTFVLSPFGPSVLSFKKVANYDSAYLIKVAQSAQALRDSPPATLGLPGISGLLAGLPVNYYPEKSQAHPVFDYGANPLFRRSGLPLLSDELSDELADELPDKLPDAPADKLAGSAPAELVHSSAE